MPLLKGARCAPSQRRAPYATLTALSGGAKTVCICRLLRLRTITFDGISPKVPGVGLLLLLGSSTGAGDAAVAGPALPTEPTHWLLGAPLLAPDSAVSAMAGRAPCWLPADCSSVERVARPDAEPGGKPARLAPVPRSLRVNRPSSLLLSSLKNDCLRTDCARWGWLSLDVRAMATVRTGPPATHCCGWLWCLAGCPDVLALPSFTDTTASGACGEPALPESLAC
mmetsp:Transcript_3059/g.7659  ORF Transcript_3059/g.7659 Transcript_3059/m.7659 type:complete len:225 (+) Transcript_3059:1840-2514(+)